MNKSEWNKIERIVASLAKDNKDAKIRNIEYEEQRKKDNAKYEEQRKKDNVKYERWQAEYQKQHAKNQKEYAKYQKEQAIRDADLDKKLALLEATTQKHANFVTNYASGVEDYFRAAIREANYRIGAIQFDSLNANEVRENRHEHESIELDALLLNGEYVGLLEVKKHLHVEDVEKFMHVTIPRFRRLYREYHAHQILPLMAWESGDSAAIHLARRYGLGSIVRRGTDTTIHPPTRVY